MTSIRWRTWEPTAKWVAQPPVDTWRVADPQAKWSAQPPTSDDTSVQEAGLMPFTISSLATAYVRVPVYADQLGVVVNPTSFTVLMAFVSGSGNPGPASWQSGSWTTTAQGQYVAQCLVGPSGGTVTLLPGTTYDVWIQIQASPETVIIDTGQMQVQ